MRVNELFYSLQGEGHFTGTPAVFVRLAGCNLRCPFCDTRHETFSALSEADIVGRAAAFPARHLVVTGGEPTLQLTASLLDALHDEGFFVQIETNGTRPLPPGARVDWTTCSPKDAPVRLDVIDELKVVYWGQSLEPYARLHAREYRLQPLASGDPERDKATVALTVEACLREPRWRLSLQTHKLLGVR